MNVYHVDLYIKSSLPIPKLVTSWTYTNVLLFDLQRRWRENTAWPEVTMTMSGVNGDVVKMMMTTATLHTTSAVKTSMKIFKYLHHETDS